MAQPCNFRGWSHKPKMARKPLVTIWGGERQPLFVLPPLWHGHFEWPCWLFYKPWMLSYNHVVYQPFVYAQSCGQLFVLSTVRPLRVAMPHRGVQVYPHSYGQLRLWTVRPLSRGERLRDRRVGGARTGWRAVWEWQTPRWRSAAPRRGRCRVGRSSATSPPSRSHVAIGMHTQAPSVRPATATPPRVRMAASIPEARGGPLEPKRLEPKWLRPPTLRQKTTAEFWNKKHENTEKQWKHCHGGGLFLQKTWKGNDQMAMVCHSNCQTVAKTTALWSESRKINDPPSPTSECYRDETHSNPTSKF